MSKKPVELETAVDDIAEMSFEDALKALENIVRSLENGQISLEESLNIYSRGTRLRQHCGVKLKDAATRIEQITTFGDGTLGVVGLDAEA